MYANIMNLLKNNLFLKLNHCYIRLNSTLGQSNYVEKIYVYNYWSRNCNELEKQYPKGKAIVLLDRQPIVKKMKDRETLTPELVKFDYDVVKKKFKEYGLDVGKENTVLLDVIPPEKEGHDYVSIIYYFFLNSLFKIFFIYFYRNHLLVFQCH